nr:methyltransferase domain-containing protein [Thiomonas sp.]
MRPTIPNVGWSRGALEPVELCPACGSAKRDARQYSRHDDGGVMPDVWRMVRCGDCRSLYLDPRPDAESLPRAYLDYYTHQAEHEDAPEGGAGGLVWSLVHGYLNWRFGMRRTPSNKFGALVFSAIEPLRLKLDYYGRHLARAQFPQPGRLLDVGCGNGAFLLRAREMGWNVAGCEPDAKAVSACQAQGLDVIRGDVFSSALDGELFDVVTISHVLEHVTDPQALLKRAKALMNPGGVLWVALPNPHSLGLRIFGAAWRGLHVPFHLCIPSQARLGRWMETTGFVSIQLKRRGAHSKRLWSDSTVIAHREQIAIRSRATVVLLRLVTDFLATLTPRWAEETVMIAYKPETSNAGRM